jgi:hypothetical protein
MSVAPRSLLDLQSYWIAQGGVSLGIVGNAVHCKGYHLGRDRIFGACACRPKNICQPGLGSRDYSAQTARDRAGLSNAASAIDLGRLGGSLANLRDFSSWLVERCRTNQPGTADFREIIYSPDGSTVLRWDRERGHASAPRPGEGDDSHLTHTHISFYRDSEDRDKRPVFEPYFDGGEMVPVLTRTPATVSLAAGVQLYDLGRKPQVKVSVAGDRYSPFVSDATFRGVVVTTGGKQQLLLVKTADAKNPRPIADTMHTVTLQIDGAETFRTEV